ncbi:MAG: proton-conducting transporter membrane subunit [Flammeovirgaceae bacterium]
MDSIIFQVLMILSLLVFVVPSRFKYLVSFITHVLLAVSTTYLAIGVLTSSQGISFRLPFNVLEHPIMVEVDVLTAFFWLIINLTCFTSILYAYGYLKNYRKSHSDISYSLHYFFLIWLHLSMLMVTGFRDGLNFLIAWELMSVTSVFLVLFDGEKKKVVKIALQYITNLHVGWAFLLLGFIYTHYVTGHPFGFEALKSYLADHESIWIFLLFFVGFGMKAGFLPFYYAHPSAVAVAPAHVSGIMSGLMTKMGIYGILRFVSYLNDDYLLLGLLLVVLSFLTAIYGILKSAMMLDIKKLLSYSSIENIGIIGVGIGASLVGKSFNISILSSLALAGALFHIINHSLFKSLLLYCAGDVYMHMKTRYIESMGGLIKKMPYTAGFFLFGALAICGMPPLNGFGSEFLIYLGVFKGLQTGGLTSDAIMLVTFVALVMTGGLSIFSFSRVFSIVFLGTPRTKEAERMADFDKSIYLPKWLIVIFMLFIGFLPWAAVQSIINTVVMSIFTDRVLLIEQLPQLQNISLVSVLFVLLLITMFAIRYIQQNSVMREYKPTWGCGYEGANPALHQYTGTSFAENLCEVANPIIEIKKDYITFEETEIFPQPRTFKTHVEDIVEKRFVEIPSNKILKFFQSFAIFQTGNLQRYVLYGLATMAIIFVLTILKWI